jgi:hypothetical protein
MSRELNMERVLKRLSASRFLGTNIGLGLFTLNFGANATTATGHMNSYVHTWMKVCVRTYEFICLNEMRFCSPTHHFSSALH